MKGKLISVGTLLVDGPIELWDDPRVTTASHCILIEFDSTDDLHEAMKRMSVEFAWPKEESSNA